jgi:hypothetical protein
MEDTTEPTVEPVESESQPQSDSETPSLSDPGKKAIAEERRRAAQAEKTAKALQAKLDAIEAENLTKEEKALKDAAEAAERATRAEAEAMRWKIAARNGISDEDAELFLTGSDEETLSKQAERFKELSSKPSKGNVVPGVGNQPNTPASIAEQIQAAEQAGDYTLAINLKSQQLADLARANR